MINIRVDKGIRVFYDSGISRNIIFEAVQRSNPHLCDKYFADIRLYAGSYHIMNLLTWETTEYGPDGVLT